MDREGVVGAANRVRRVLHPGEPAVVEAELSDRERRREDLADGGVRCRRAAGREQQKKRDER